MSTDSNTKFSLILHTKENFRLIENLLEKRLPNSAMMYNTIKLLASGRFDKSSFMKIEIFACNEELVNEKETFLVAIVTSEYPISVILISFPDDPSEEKLKQFEMTIDWENPYHFEVCGTKFSSFMENLMQLKSKGAYEERERTSFYTLDIEDALKYNTDDSIKDQEVTIKPVSLSDAEIIVKDWYTDGPLDRINFIKNSIELVGSAGVYVDGRMASSVVTSTIGTLNCLNTLGEFRRRGFAQVSVKAMSKYLASIGLIPCANIVEGNSSSQLLFEKLGFRCARTSDFIRYFPSCDAN